MRRLAAVFGLAGLLGALVAGPVRADDYVSVRGVYYREPSTRVVQPIVEVERDSPSGIDVGAHFLIDAITSASASAGTGRDVIFTETRNEAGLMLRKRWSRSELSAGYRYSAESDYWSHSVGISGATRLWADTATLRLALGRNFDSMASRLRLPDCAVAPSTSCPLDVWFAGVSYTQVLSPRAILQANFDSAYLDGFQGNLYRTVPDGRFEVLPYPAGGLVGQGRRMRHAAAVRLGYYFPETATGVQLAYRYYWDWFPGTSATPYDPWNLRSHTGEARVFQEIAPNLELRVLYRVYWQPHGAAFWCDTIANRSCYLPTDPYLQQRSQARPRHHALSRSKALLARGGAAAVSVLPVVRGGQFRDRLRPLLPEHQLRRRSRAAGRLHDAILKRWRWTPRPEWRRGFPIGVRSPGCERPSSAAGRRSTPSGSCCWGRFF